MPSLSPESRRALLRAANHAELTADQVTDMLETSQLFYQATGINPILEPDVYIKFYVEEGEKYLGLDDSDDPEPAS